MLKDKKHKILIAASAVFVTLIMALTAVSAISGSFSTYSGNPEFAPNATAPPYNITLMEKGLPSGTMWHVRGYTGITNGNSFSNTQYINYTGIYNGSFYFTVYSYSTATNSYAPNPSAFTLMISGSNVKQVIVFSNTTIPTVSSTYDLNFSITNMPKSIPGSPQWYWTVSVTGVNVPYGVQTSSYGSDLYLYGLQNGTYDYKAWTYGATQSNSNIYGTAVTPPSGQFTVNGKNVNINMQLHFLKQYNLKFKESGLPSSQSYTVDLNSPSLGTSLSNQTYVSVSNSVNFKLLNGTYYYDVYAGSSSYAATPFQGTVTISGAGVSVNVAFKMSTSSYNALFRISNPPLNLQGTHWSWEVYLNGNYYTSYNSTLAVAGLTNGTYFFDLYGNGIGFTSSSGSFAIAGKALTINLQVQSTYTVMFRIQNLSSFATGPPYLTSVITNTANGFTYNSSSYNGTLIISDIVNGTYQYYVTVPPPYSLSKTTGSFTVNGTGVTVALHGTEGSMYLIQFQETGIPLWGSSWGVVIDNGFTYNDTYTSPYLSNTNSPLPYIVSVPNGTYTVQGFIYYNGHYHFTAPKTVKVSGSSLNVTLSFASSSPSSGLSVFDNLLLLVAIIVAIVVIAGLSAYFVRRRGKGES